MWLLYVHFQVHHCFQVLNLLTHAKVLTIQETILLLNLVLFTCLIILRPIKV